MHVEDFSLSKDDKWGRVSHVQRKSCENASGRPSHKTKSGSAEDFPFIQTQGNEKQCAILPSGH